MPEIKEILSHIDTHRRTVAPRLRRLSAYYLGRHDILDAPRDPFKPDNRLVNNFCRGITDATVGYFMGRGVSYASEDEALLAAVRRVGAENSERFANNAIARDLSVCGQAAELLWYDDIGHPRFTPLSPETVIPVYDGAIEPSLAYAIRVFRRGEDEDATVEVYDRAERVSYRYDGATLVETERTPHYFGDVPLVLYENNRDRQGDFEPVLTLVDAYNRLQSDSVNDFELFADSYLAISGMGGTTEEDLARIRRDRVILLEEGGDAKWLTKTADDAYIENMKSRLARDIYRFSGTVDLGEEFFTGSAPSAASLRYRLIHFENRVAVTEQYFRRGLIRRWRLICHLLSLSGETLSPDALRVIFSRNLPDTGEVAADMAEKLSGILSRRSVIEHLPQIEDAEAEMARIRAEEGGEDA